MNIQPPIGRVPGAVPLIGHAVPLLRDPLRLLRELPRHGDLVELRVGPARLLVVCDPGLLHQALVEDRTFDKGGPFYESARRTTGNSLATCTHDEHRRQRRMIQPLFTRERIARYASVMSEEIAAVTGSWCDGQTIEVLDHMKTITSRCAIRTMFSTLAKPTAKLMADDLNIIMLGIWRRSIIPARVDRLPLVGNRAFDRALARFWRVIEETIVEYRTEGAARGDLLSLLMESQDAPDTAGGGQVRFSDREIRDQITTFFIGGVNTAAEPMAWALHLLARHPEFARRLCDETDTVLDGATASYDDLPKLELTRRIITETMRLYPPVWIVTRTATADARLGGHRIPAGSTLVLSPYVIHHRADLYPDPERFDPDRWLPDGGTARPPHSYLPFVEGARKCIAHDYAAVEATLALASIAARWTLEAVPGSTATPQPKASLPPGPTLMRVKSRKGGTI